MKLYTERNGLRTTSEKTYSINAEMYTLLFNCCRNYKKNLTHIFTLNCHDSFTNKDYIAFDESGFETRIKVKIPSLFRNGNGKISIPQTTDAYDQYALLDLIEFFAQNIKDISERWNNEKYKNYKTIECYDSSKIFINFQSTINEIFSECGLLYELTDKKIINRLVNYNPGMEEKEQSILSIKEPGTVELLQEAIALYKNPSPKARQASVEKIWDAFERLKTYYKELVKKKSGKSRSVEKIIQMMSNDNPYFYSLFDTEFKSLTDLGNNCRIRHHETNKVDIIDARYYDYLFDRCLALIALAIKYLD